MSAVAARTASTAAAASTWSRATSATSSRRTASVASATARSRSVASTTSTARGSTEVNPVRILAAALALGAAAVAGCGLGPGKSTGDVDLTVTRDYGTKVLRQKQDSIHESDTVLRVLDRNADVTTRYGGGFVQSIDGLSGAERRAHAATGSSTSTASSRRSAPPSTTSPAATGSGGTTATGPRRCACRRWSAPGRSPSCTASRGSARSDVVDCRASERGLRGRLATACRRSGRSRCDRATQASVQRSGCGSGPGAGPATIPASTCSPAAPSQSGVFARFVGARKPLLELLNQQGQPAGSLGKGGGLVAALRPGDGPPTWVVTGTDAKGVVGGREPRSDRRCATATRSPRSRGRAPIGVPVQ